MATGGIGATYAPGQEQYGGNGGAGRIRVEYCETLSGTTNPLASTQKLDCYIAEQTTSSTARVNLPETFSNGRTYKVQFGRKLNFTAAGNKTVALRVPAGMFSTVQLDALVSGLAADTTLTLDVGNDSVNDWSGNVGNNSTNPSPNLAAAFTAYWRAQGSPTSGTLNVPVKVTLGSAGQVLLTNLQVQTTGSRVRQVQLPVQSYTAFNLDFTLGGTGAVAIDIGDNGSIDWSGNAASVRQLTGNLATALNGYLAGKSGTVAVPLRFYVSPDHTVTLNDYHAAFNQTAALSANSLQIGSLQAAGTAAINIREGDRVPLQATIRNNSSQTSGLLTAAFFAYAPGWGDWYIGSDFVKNLAANGSAPVNINWDTTGFSGEVAVKVVVNPYGRLTETNYTDNVQQLTIPITPLRAEQTITFANPGQQTLSNAPFALNATASSGLAVSFTALTPDICTVSGNTVTLLAVGTCTVRATQNGDSAFNAAATVAQSFAVVAPDPNKSNQSISFGPLATKTIGDPSFALNATASSGLPVSFSSLTTTICTMSSNTVTLLQAGTCQIQAAQNGDATYNPASSVTQSFTIAKQNQTINFGALADKTLGDSAFALTASASSSLPVSFTSQTSTVCTVAGGIATLVNTGQCTVRAAQIGNQRYNPAVEVTQSFMVNAPIQLVNVIDFGPLLDRLLTESIFVVSATASSGLPVTFTALPIAVCTVSGNTVTLRETGFCTIQASQSGNEQYPVATSVERSFSIRSVVKTDQSITFGSLSDRLLGESPFTVSAIASSGLPVSFTAATTEVCKVAENMVTLLKEGKCAIQASQEGNEKFNPAPLVEQRFMVRSGTPPTPAITFDPLPDITLDGETFSLNATTSSGLPVTFTSLTPDVCTVTGNVVTLLQAGSCSIQATQAGDDSHPSAEPVTRTFQVMAPIGGNSVYLPLIER